MTDELKKPMQGLAAWLRMMSTHAVNMNESDVICGWASDVEAALAAAAPSVAAGWRWVPVEPTPEMWAAANKRDDERFAGGNSHGADIEELWHVLLSAAPTSPAVVEGQALDDGVVEAQNEPCPHCGKPVHVAYGPDIRFNPPDSRFMWRAECSGDCLNPSFTCFTREQALGNWNNAIRAAKPSVDMRNLAPYCAKLARPCPDGCATIQLTGCGGGTAGDCWRVKATA